MQEIQTGPKQDYKNYLKLAETGHFPLFFQDWLSESFNQPHNLAFRKANTNVKHVFNQLARHKTLEKKKTALIGMDRLSREEFIRSFFKVVEYQMMKDIKSLQ